MTALTKKSALDADVPRTGRAADAYEVACTATMLAERKPLAVAYPGQQAREAARHAVTLHRISGHLHRLAERACNEDLGCRECDGEGRIAASFPAVAEGKPTWASCRACAGHGTTTGRRLERLRRDATAIAERYGLRVYFQGDPRGCSMYLYDPATIMGPDAESRLKEAWLRYDNDKGEPSWETLVARWIDANYGCPFWGVSQ